MPLSTTWPLLGRSRPASNASNVDLPAPEAPTIATDSPGWILKLTSARMVRRPSGLLTCLLIFFAVRTAPFLVDDSGMRLIVSLLFLLCAANAESSGPPNILIYGDSLSAGYGLELEQSWAALLQERLQQQGYEHRVVNASISGETTEGGVTRIDSALADFSPTLVVLELGANDGLRGFSTSRMKSNLEAIIAKAQASGATVILLGIRIPSNYGARYSREFEAVFQQVSSATNIEWIEFFMHGIALNDDFLQNDRIHPNAAAQPLLLDNAWPMISAALRP